jgi:hypothetical protein
MVSGRAADMSLLHYAGAQDPLARVLLSLPPGEARLVLCGPFPGEANAWRRYLLSVPAGWRAVVKVARANGACDAYLTSPAGDRVRVTSTGTWFGPQALEPAAAERLFGRLQWHLKREFHRESAVPLITPAVAGMDLWRQEQGDCWPELDARLQELIRTTAGQARRELLTVPELAALSSFQCWDMRFAYADFCERLPVGPVTEDREPELPAVGRVRVDFRPPADWRHVGILPSKEYGVGMVFPSAYRWESGWCDAREARLALASGWEVRVRERLVMQEGRPLDCWSRRLRRLYERFEGMAEPELKGAIRRILVATIGSFQGRGNVELRVMPTARGTRIEVPMEQARRREKPSHPEWSGAVWARCRYRLAKHMLTLPRDLILGCHTDCIYLAGDPGWRNAAAIGQLRLKGVLLASGPAPKTKDELRALSDLASRGEEPEEEESDGLA